MGLVSVTVFMLVMPLFKASGGILLQMAPPSIPSSALSKSWRQVNPGHHCLHWSHISCVDCDSRSCHHTNRSHHFFQVSSREDIAEVSQARFWELVPGYVVGSLSLQVCMVYTLCYCLLVVSSVDARLHTGEARRG